MKLDLTEKETQALLGAILTANNVYVDFPEKANDTIILRQIFARLTPIESSGIKVQSSVYPETRNSTPKSRI